MMPRLWAATLDSRRTPQGNRRKLRRWLGIAVLLTVLSAVVYAARMLPLFLASAQHVDYSRPPLWRSAGVDWSVPPEPGPVRVDSLGVRVIDYGGDLGVQYNPVSIGSYAYTLSHELERPAAREAFFAQVGWLLANGREDARRGLVWEYRFDWESNQQRAPWASGMAQGLALLALTRAYKATGDSTYLAASRRALRIFDLDEGQGGVRLTTRSGAVIYREYPGSASVVLDGWMTALVGMHEYHDASGDTTAQRLLSQGIVSLERLLPHFYGPLGVYYSSRGNLANKTYFATNYHLLRYLARRHPSLRRPLRKWDAHVRHSAWQKYLRVAYMWIWWSPDRVDPVLGPT